MNSARFIINYFKKKYTNLAKIDWNKTFISEEKHVLEQILLRLQNCSLLVVFVYFEMILQN